MVTVKEIHGKTEGDSIRDFMGIIEKTWEYKAGVNNFGPWSFQNLMIKDETGEKIDVKLQNRIELTDSSKGVHIFVSAVQGKKNAYVGCNLEFYNNKARISVRESGDVRLYENGDWVDLSIIDKNPHKKIPPILPSSTSSSTEDNHDHSHYFQNKPKPPIETSDPGSKKKSNERPIPDTKSGSFEKKSAEPNYSKFEARIRSNIDDEKILKTLAKSLAIEGTISDNQINYYSKIIGIPKDEKLKIKTMCVSYAKDLAVAGKIEHQEINHKSFELFKCCISTEEEIPF